MKKLLLLAACADRIIDRLTCLCAGHVLVWHTLPTGEVIRNCYGEERQLARTYAVCHRGRCGYRI